MIGYLSVVKRMIVGYVDPLKLSQVISLLIRDGSVKKMSLTK
jgi:hypothetical protein